MPDGIISTLTRLVDRIMNSSNVHTFDRTTDSLEAIRNFMAFGGAGSPGLCYYGVVSTLPGGNTFTSDLLMGHGNSYFVGYRIWVVRQVLGAGALPQLTGRTCTGYVSATGLFTYVSAFTPVLSVGDEILLIHPAITDKLVAAGSLTTSSVTQPCDNLRAEAAQFFRGSSIQMMSGPVATQTRSIVYYEAGGLGRFTLDLSNPFTALPGVGSVYVIWGGDFPVVAVPDGTSNLTPGDVIGTKGDTTKQDITGTYSLVRYLKGIVDGLFTAVGVIAWPARALAAANIAITSVLRYIVEVKPEWAARTAATHTTTTLTEETILTTAYTVPGKFSMDITLRNMLAGDDFTFRVYKRVDGTNYDPKSEVQYLGSPTRKVYSIEDEYIDGTEHLKVTVQRASGTDRAFPFVYNCIKQPVV